MGKILVTGVRLNIGRFVGNNKCIKCAHTVKAKVLTMPTPSG